MLLRVLAAALAASLAPTPAHAEPVGPRAFHPPLLLDSSVAAPGRSTLLREIGVAGAAIGAGFLLDDTIEPGSGDGTFVDEAGNVLGSPYVLGGGTLLVGVGGWAGHDERKLSLARDLAVALVATTGTVVLLKATVDRERPDGSDDDSFPSGHSANSFAAATILDQHYGGVIRWIAYGAAAFIAASRVIGNHHWFSDVVAGAAIGRFCARVMP